MKKVIVLFLAALMIFLLISCSNDSVEDVTDSVSTTVSDGVNTETVTELVTKVITNDEGVTEIVTEVIEVEVETSEIETTKKPAVTTEDKTTNKAPQTSNNPADWSMEEVVEFYKKACANSSHVTSKQTMVMRKDTLKADGALGTFLNFAEGIIRGVMKLNAIDVEGITGGHWDLTVSDCKSAKAYKSGEYIVVELTMKDQVDGIYGKTFEGTVGHGISVVDGVAEVVEQFPQFDIRYKEADIKIHYTDAVVKAKINDKGIVEKGTWKYVCTPVINNLYIEGMKVNNAGAVIDYEVTLNGGF